MEGMPDPILKAEERACCLKNERERLEQSKANARFFPLFHLQGEESFGHEHSYTPAQDHASGILLHHLYSDKRIQQLHPIWTERVCPFESPAA